MSFSANVKQEVCRLPLSKRCCSIAECFGIALYCNTFSPQLLKIVTESPDFAERLPRLFKKAFGFGFDAAPEGGERAGKLVFLIHNGEKLRQIFQAFGFSIDAHVALHVNFGVLEDECCRVAFLRGAFLAGGSVTDPEKRYHLELITTHRKVSAETNALLLDLGFFPKDTTRNGGSVLYFKQSNYIEDFLTTIGAPVCAMGVMEAKVEKDLRNGVNRRVNCDTANLTKAVDAAFDQVAAIHKLRDAGVLESLPPRLRETALLRLDEPEATLTELAERLDPKLTKSALNHRMRKLIALSKEV